ncbi:uncharacterized protein LOC130802649 [Amaranthus tricolor]|uniref:uncharacterized protein LOC130802649 n=1 Tax=Amaranthus tricolor TaxID=29722 RepID=UPI0025834AC1|nr:uncharacterized protein LOC130802649 [Amaranthus tricolor]
MQVISERNCKNRNSAKRTMHTTGNLSFPESEDVLTKENDNVKLTADKVWLIQHTRKNDQGKLEWLDTRSKEIHVKLKDVVASAGDSMTQDEILLRVLGQKSGHVRGKGTGIRAYSKEKAQIEQRKIVEQQQEKIQEQQQQIKDLMESQLLQQRQFEEYKAQQQEAIESMKQSILQQLQSKEVQ